MNNRFAAGPYSLNTFYYAAYWRIQMQTEPLSLEELAGKVGSDAGGALGVLLAYIGDQCGVYRALEASGPID